MENKNTPDYVKAEQDLDSLYFSLGIEGKRSSPVLTTEPHANEKSWPHFEYEFLFAPVNATKKGSFKITYSCGASKEEQNKRTPAIDRLPKPQTVLACACSESLEAHDTGFENWASNFGFDVDSRKAGKIYNTCAQQYFQLLTLISVENLVKLAELHNRL